MTATMESSVTSRDASSRARILTAVNSAWAVGSLAPNASGVRLS